MKLAILAAALLAAYWLARYVKAASTPALPNYEPAEDEAGFGLGPGYRTVLERVA